MELIKLKELSEQLNLLRCKPKSEIDWKDIDPIRNLLEGKCFKINNEQEAEFIVWLVEHYFYYEFYKPRYREDVIINSVKWWYMCFGWVSWWWSPDDYAKDIFRSMKIDACFIKDIGERYKEVKVRELEKFRWTDIKLLINKFIEDWLI